MGKTNTKTSIKKKKNKKTATEAPAASRKSSRPAAVHIRTKPAKDADTLCGGSHSELWNRSGDRPLQSVGPQQASKATCGRCKRVAASPRHDLL